MYTFPISHTQKRTETIDPASPSANAYWRFQQQVADLHETSGSQVGDVLYMYMVKAMHEAGMVAEYIDHGNYSYAALHLAEIVTSGMDWLEQNGSHPIVNKVIELSQLYAIAFEPEDVSVQRPGLF